MAPRVSVIIPCYNEGRTTPRVLEAIHDQSVPLADLEVIVADGMSDDGTREVVAEFARAHPQLKIRLVDNRTRSIPAALNRAIESSSGPVVLRIDAHAIPYPDSVDRSIEAPRRRGRPLPDEGPGRRGRHGAFRRLPPGVARSGGALRREPPLQ